LIFPVTSWGISFTIQGRKQGKKIERTGLFEQGREEKKRRRRKREDARTGREDKGEGRIHGVARIVKTEEKLFFLE